MSLVKNCNICEGPLGSDKGIKCDFCSLPLHTTCSGLSRAEVSCFLSASRRISYQCKNCIDKKDDISELKQLIRDLSQQVNELKEKQIENSSVSTPEVTEHLISEIRERNLRNNNVIMFNLPESTSSTLEERTSNDKAAVEETIRSIVNTPIEIRHVIRLGRPNPTRSRPVKVVLKNEYDAINVLKSKHNLPSNSEIRINSDLTPMQRDYLNSLRNQLKQRQDKGESDITIKYIRGTPTIIKTAPKK